MKNKFNILIVGGTGFIGYHLAEACLKKGWKVSSISAHKPKKKRFLSKVKYIVCDISNKQRLRKKIKNDYDYVVNLGGYIDHINKRKTYNSHYLGCKNLSNIFSKKKIKTFVQMGSGGEYGRAKSPHNEKLSTNPKSIYSKSKFLATKYLLSLYKKKNFPVTILRLYQAYGPKQEVNRLIPIAIDSCFKNKEFACSNGKQYRDFVHVDDVVKSIFKCLNNKKAEGEIINIGTGKPKKIKNIINLIKNKIKSGYPQFGKIKLRPEETVKIYPKISKAKKVLGWRPKIKFKSGLSSTIKSYQHDQKAQKYI